MSAIGHCPVVVIVPKDPDRAVIGTIPVSHGRAKEAIEAIALELGMKEGEFEVRLFQTLDVAYSERESPPHGDAPQTED